MDTILTCKQSGQLKPVDQHFRGNNPEKLTHPPGSFRFKADGTMVGAKNIKGGMISDEENEQVYSGDNEGVLIEKKELVKRGHADF